MGKTIRMPKDLLAKWLDALRSGGYRQARGVLYRPKSGGFCCLGVLQHCVTGGEVEVDKEGNFLDMPTEGWLSENGIVFLNRYGESGKVEPFLPTLECYASEANDSERKRFSTIADAIEACAEGY